MIPELNKYEISDMRAFNELCYIVNTMNLMIGQTNSLCAVYQFLQYARQRIAHPMPPNMHGIVYSFSTIDRDTATIQKALQVTHDERTAFVADNADRLLYLVGVLKNQFVVRKNNGGTYNIGYRKNPSVDLISFLSAEAVDYAAASHQLEQLMR